MPAKGTIWRLSLIKPRLLSSSRSDSNPSSAKARRSIVMAVKQHTEGDARHRGRPPGPPEAGGQYRRGGTHGSTR